MISGLVSTVLVAKQAFGELSDMMRGLAIGFSIFAGFWMMVAMAIFVDSLESEIDDPYDYGMSILSFDPFIHLSILSSFHLPFVFSAGFAFAIISWLAYWISIPFIHMGKST